MRASCRSRRTSTSAASARSGASTTRRASPTRPRGRTEHDLAPAAGERPRVCLLVVDAQNTFCTPGFELFVAGRTGTGALDDSRRLCAFLYHHLNVVTQTVVTLDTHQAFQIFHAPFLVDAEGRHPIRTRSSPPTTSRRAAGASIPPPAELLGLDRADEHLAAYVETLAAGGKYDLTIWPFHAMLGGIGHALVSAVEEALFFHAIARRVADALRDQGRQPADRALLGARAGGAAGADGERLGERNNALVEYLAGFDAVLVAGQAKSHCVAWTVEDLLADVPELAPRLYLLEDCTSPVVVPGAVDYSDDAHEAFARFAEAGAHVVRSTDPDRDLARRHRGRCRVVSSSRSRSSLGSIRTSYGAASSARTTSGSDSRSRLARSRISSRVSDRIDRPSRMTSRSSGLPSLSPPASPSTS